MASAPGGVKLPFTELGSPWEEHVSELEQKSGLGPVHLGRSKWCSSENAQRRGSRVFKLEAQEEVDIEIFNWDLREDI